MASRPSGFARASICAFCERGRRWSWMNTAVMGVRAAFAWIRFRWVYNFPFLRREFTFLEMYLGPGCGSIPSSVRSRTQTHARVSRSDRTTSASPVGVGRFFRLQRLPLTFTVGLVWSAGVAVRPLTRRRRSSSLSSQGASSRPRNSVPRSFSCQLPAVPTVPGVRGRGRPRRGSSSTCRTH